MKSRWAKKPGKLSDHFGSTDYQNAYISFMNPSRHVDVLLHAELWRAKVQKEAETIENEKIIKILTLFFPMFPFDPPENIRKPKVF